MILTSATMPDNAAAAWAARDDELARWAWALVNRTDVWGGYHNPEDRGKEYRKADGTVAKLGQTTTRPAPSRRGQVRLMPAHLARHFRGRQARDLVGLHTTSPSNTSRWGATEIDWHGPDSTAPAVNEAAGIGWYGKLASLGFAPLLTDSNGLGGFHLEALFAEPVPTPLVYAFLRWLTADHAAYGLPQRTECFPKQPRVDEHNPYGNWLRLPGRHHTRPHWSKVWDGSRWLNGEAAVSFILGIKGSPSSLIPACVEAAPPRPAPVVSDIPLSLLGHVDADLARRIAAYVRKLPNLAEGQGRDDVAYNLACWLVRDLALSDADALPWLALWDGRNLPPKGEDRLREILSAAHKYGKHPIGCGLAAAPLPRRSRPVRVPTWATAPAQPESFTLTI